MTIPFLSQEISGLATQTYNSGAVNRKFINDVSGAIWTEFDSLDTFNADDYITSANSLSIFANSAATQTKLDTKYDSTSDVEIALGGATISSNAKSSYDWFVASAQALSDYQASGDEWSSAYDWYTASAQKLSDNNSGWASVPVNNPISHGLSAKPNSVLVTPSGLITFAYAVTGLCATTFGVAISAPGNRMISWRAEV